MTQNITRRSILKMACLSQMVAVAGMTVGTRKSIASTIINSDKLTKFSGTLITDAEMSSFLDHSADPGDATAIRELNDPENPQIISITGKTASTIQESFSEPHTWTPCLGDSSKDDDSLRTGLLVVQNGDQVGVAFSSMTQVTYKSLELPTVSSVNRTMPFRGGILVSLPKIWIDKTKNRSYPQPSGRYWILAIPTSTIPR